MSRAAPAPDGGLWTGIPQARWVLPITTPGSIPAMVDGTDVDVAAGRTAGNLDPGFSGLRWTVDADRLPGLALLVRLGGSPGDRPGRRRHVGGVVRPAAASLPCGPAPDDAGVGSRGTW